MATEKTQPPDMRVPRPIPLVVYYLGLLLIYFAFVAYYLPAIWMHKSGIGVQDFLVSGLLFTSAYFGLMALRSKVYLMDPLIFLGLSLCVSVFIKIPYLARNTEALDTLLANLDISVFTNATYLMMLAVCIFMFVYASVQKGRSATPVVYDTRWSHGLIFWLCFMITAGTLVAAMLTIHEIGVTSLLEDFSAKRFLEGESSASRFDTSLYFYYKLALLSKITCYVFVVYYLLNNGHIRNGWKLWLLFVLSAAIAVMIPIIFSARAHAALVMMDILVIAAFAGFKLKKKYLVLGFVAIYVMLYYTTLQRMGAEQYKSVLASFLERRYLMDVTKNAHIFEYFRETNQWFYGETLIGWLFVPVPSSLMEAKPLFANLGQWIGYNIYGFPINGVPPGFVAELFMNFGVAGMVIGMFVMALTMGMFWRWFIRRTLNPIILVFGSMVVVRFGVFLFNNDFGTFMIKILIEALPAALLVWAGTKRVALLPLKRETPETAPA